MEQCRDRQASGTPQAESAPYRLCSKDSKGNCRENPELIQIDRKKVTKFWDSLHLPRLFSGSPVKGIGDCLGQKNRDIYPGSRGAAGFPLPGRPIVRRGQANMRSRSVYIAAQLVNALG